MLNVTIEDRLGNRVELLTLRIDNEVANVGT